MAVCALATCSVSIIMSAVLMQGWSSRQSRLMGGTSPRSSTSWQCAHLPNHSVFPHLIPSCHCILPLSKRALAQRKEPRSSLTLQSLNALPCGHDAWVGCEIPCTVILTHAARCPVERPPEGCAAGEALRGGDCVRGGPRARVKRQHGGALRCLVSPLGRHPQHRGVHPHGHHFRGLRGKLGQQHRYPVPV